MKKINSFCQLITFVIIISLTFFVNLKMTFLLSIIGIIYLMIQNKKVLSLKYLSISILFIVSIMYIMQTNNTYLGLLGWLMTIMFKLLPTIIFGSSLGLVPINELRNIMLTLKIPSELQMALIVGIRYFSILNDEFHEIKQARLTHGLSLRNPIYYKKPLLIMEYYLIPTLMRTDVKSSF